jgi:hypothetical protein
MLRCILGVIGGLVCGSAVNMAIIMLSWLIYPLPQGTDLSDRDAMAAYIQSLPTLAFIVVLIAHAGGAFVGGVVAGLIARRSPVILGAIVGGFFLVGGILNVMGMPCPLWFAVADLVSYLPCGIAGAIISSSPRKG